jgi:hypothetical protein
MRKSGMLCGSYTSDRERGKIKIRFGERMGLIHRAFQIKFQNARNTPPGSEIECGGILFRCASHLL